MSEQTPSPAPSYIWQHAAWPKLTFDALALAPALDQARLEQGRLLGLLEAIGLDQAQEVQRELWVQEALATAAIEGATQPGIGPLIGGAPAGPGRRARP